MTPALLVLIGLVLASAEPDITVTPIARDGHVLVSFDLSDAFTQEMRDTIQSGLPTTFSYEIDLRRGASWLDRTVASTAISATVRFDNLTRRYQLSRSFDGRLEDARPEDAIDAVQGWMTHFDRIPLATTSTLEANGEYYVRVRAHTQPRNAWFVWPWSGTVLGRAQFTFIQ